MIRNSTIHGPYLIEEESILANHKNKSCESDSVEGGIILIISSDRKLREWASSAFNAQCHIVRKPDHPRIHGKPASVIIGCNYKCDANYCTKAFSLATSRPGLLPVIAMPLVLKRSIPILLGYFMFYPANDSSSLILPLKIIPSRRANGQETWALYRGIRLSKRELTIIEAQQYIIGRRGRIKRIAELGANQKISPLVLSKAFGNQCGLPLKRFINKIRLCQSLWELVQTESPIKRIALDAGYRPNSFSLRFYHNYGLWPSDIRSIKETVSLEEIAFMKERIPVMRLRHGAEPNGKITQEPSSIKTVLHRTPRIYRGFGVEKMDMDG